MNLVDILIWVVLLIFAVKGFMKGLFKEVCSLLGLLFGGWAALAFHYPLGEVLRLHIKISPVVISVVSFVIVFFAVWTFFILLGFLLTTFAKVVLLGGVNRFCGVVLGLTQGGLLLSLLLPNALAKPMPDSVKRTVLEARSSGPFLACGGYLYARWNSGQQSGAAVAHGTRQGAKGRVLTTAGQGVK